MHANYHTGVGVDRKESVEKAIIPVPSAAVNLLHPSANFPTNTYILSKSAIQIFEVEMQMHIFMYLLYVLLPCLSESFLSILPK